MTWLAQLAILSFTFVLTFVFSLTALPHNFFPLRLFYTHLSLHIPCLYSAWSLDQCVPFCQYPAHSVFAFQPSHSLFSSLPLSLFHSIHPLSLPVSPLPLLFHPFFYPLTVLSPLPVFLPSPSSPPSDPPPLSSSLSPPHSSLPLPSYPQRRRWRRSSSESLPWRGTSPRRSAQSVRTIRSWGIEGKVQVPLLLLVHSHSYHLCLQLPLSALSYLVISALILSLSWLTRFYI